MLQTPFTISISTPLRGPEPRSGKSKLGVGDGSWAITIAGPPEQTGGRQIDVQLDRARAPREVERLANAIGVEAVVLRSGRGQQVPRRDRRRGVANDRVTVGKHHRVGEPGTALGKLRLADAGAERGVYAGRADRAPVLRIQLARAPPGLRSVLEGVAESGGVEAAVPRNRNVGPAVEADVGRIERHVGPTAVGITARRAAPPQAAATSANAITASSSSSWRLQ